MTEAMNFFQSLFSLNNFAPETINRHEAKLIKALIKDAKTLADEAEREAEFGETALNLMRETEKTGDKQNMATIAVWHFAHALQKFQKATARYGEAGRIQTKKSRIFFAEAEAMSARAGEVEATVKFLNDFLKQN